MNKWKKWIAVAFFAVTILVVFWITYTQTENIGASTGITAGVSIGLSVLLSWLGKLDQRNYALHKRDRHVVVEEPIPFDIQNPFL